MPTPAVKVVPGLPQLTATTDYCSGMGGRGALLSPGCGGSRGGGDCGAPPVFITRHGAA